MIFLGFLGKRALVQMQSPMCLLCEIPANSLKVHITIVTILMIFRGRNIAESSETEMQGK